MYVISNILKLFYMISLHMAMQKICITKRPVARQTFLYKGKLWNYRVYLHKCCLFTASVIVDQTAGFYDFSFIFCHICDIE